MDLIIERLETINRMIIVKNIKDTIILQPEIKMMELCMNTIEEKLNAYPDNQEVLYDVETEEIKQRFIMTKLVVPYMYLSEKLS